MMLKGKAFSAEMESGTIACFMRSSITSGGLSTKSQARSRACGPHRIFVFLYPSGKGLQFRKFAALYPSKPGVETLSSTCAQYQSKLLNEIISPIDFRVDLTKLNQHLLFLDA